MLSYYKPIIKNDYVYSIDMIRFKFKLNDYNFKILNEYLNEKCNYDYYTSFKLANYKYLVKVKYLDSSFSLGLLFNGFERKTNDSCFIEFNPNKVGYCKELLHILDFINENGIELDLVCYDIAIDIPFKRNNVYLVKDRRVHKKFTYSQDGVNVTEYLGVDAESGRVKLYNKTIESNLDYDCTRLEITSKQIDYEIFIKQFPKVMLSSELSLLDYIKLSKTDKVLLDLLMLSGDCYSYFQRLGKDKQQSLKLFLMQEGREVSISLEIFEKIKKIIFYFKNYKKMLDK